MTFIDPANQLAFSVILGTMAGMGFIWFILWRTRE